MEDGRIADSQLSASSVYNGGYGPAYARLNRPAGGGTYGGWSAGVSNHAQWIQVHLGVAKMVSGVVLQGSGNINQWVTQYKVQYGNDINTLLTATPVISQYQDKLVSHTHYTDTQFVI